MAFSLVTLSHEWRQLDGTAASGTVDFMLTRQMANTGVTYATSITKTATLDGTGSISVTIPANDDAGTVPDGTTYQVIEKIAGASEQTTEIVVPSASAGQTIDLKSLYPQTASV